MSFAISLSALWCALMAKPNILGFSLCTLPTFAVLFAITNPSTLSLLIGLIIGVFLFIRWRKIQKTGNVRKMSFTSGLMAAGAFVPEIKMPMPIINSTLFFDEVPTRDEVKQMSEELTKFVRFSSIPIEMGFGDWGWKKVDVNIDQHLIEHHTSDNEETHKLIENLIMQPLKNTGCPLWEIHLISSNQRPSVVIVRVDHSIADGISLIAVMNKIFKDTNGESLETAVPFTRKEKKYESKMSILRKIIKSLIKILSIASSPFDTDIIFNGKNKEKLFYNGKRKIIVLPMMDLKFIKSLKDAANVSLNDILFSATCGAIRQYSIEKQDPKVIAGKDSKVQTRALVPVAFPRTMEMNLDEFEVLNNKWCFISADMPVGIEGTLQRLKATNQVMEELKNSPTAPIQLFFQNSIFSCLPLNFVRKISSDSFKRHTLVFSNVPGPQYPVTFCGKTLLGIQMLFPSLIPQIGIVSYNGKIFMNVILDPEIVDDPRLFRKCFENELRSLAKELDVPIVEFQSETRKSSNEPEQVENSTTTGDNKKTWKEKTGRTSGKDGYQVGDLCRYVIQKVKSKTEENETEYK